MRRQALAIVFGILAAQVPARAQRDEGFLVVVNASNPATSISREQLSQIFLKRVERWPNGAPVDPIDLAPSAPPRVAFTTAIHHKAVRAVRTFWQQQIYSGRDVPPPEKETEQDVIAYVRSHPGAVGYV